MPSKNLTKNEISEIRALHIKKYRQMYGKFLVEGKKAVSELLRSPLTVSLLIRTDASEVWMEPALLKEEILRSTTPEHFSQISTQSTPDGILAVAEIPSDSPFRIPSPGQWSLVLDGIADPGNLGTIIRTAEWFGAQQVCLLEGCADRFNPKTVAASMGSLFRQETLILRDLSPEILSETVPYGALLDGENVFDEDLSRGGLLFIGSESHGIREETLPLIRKSIRIPGAGITESLNAGVAAGILMSEFFRQTRQGKKTL